MRRVVVFFGALAVALAGCGSSEPDRTSGGMATGAGTGAVIGLIGGPIGVVVGAAVGAGAGALTATNTSPHTVNLGDPLWARAPGVAAPNGGGPMQPSPADGGLPPPQPLESAATYGVPPAAPGQPAPPVGPAPAGAPVPLTNSIQSQPLPAPQ
jgi:hypothetical protein